MKIELDEVYTIKIANGDEIVAKITEEKDNAFMIQKPLVVIPGPQGIQLVSALFTGNQDSDVSLNKSQCSMITLSRDEVRDGYIETTTGIRPVSNKILMG